MALTFLLPSPSWLTASQSTRTDTLASAGDTSTGTLTTSCAGRNAHRGSDGRNSAFRAVFGSAGELVGGTESLEVEVGAMASYKWTDSDGADGEGLVNRREEAWSPVGA